jgi:hypothetical protein
MGILRGDHYGELVFYTEQQSPQTFVKWSHRLHISPPRVLFSVTDNGGCTHRDISTRKAVVMDIRTNSFCASGMHLPNGSFVTFGGNDGITVGGKPGSQLNPDHNTGAWDAVYQDFDGRRSIRILNPCKISDNLNGGPCAWFDQPDQLSMKKQRFYSTAEPNADGRIIMIGGMVFGGYINRNTPNVDQATEGGMAEPTYEYFPAKDGDPQVLKFVVQTSGLNAYPHAFLMPSGRILLQANVSTSAFQAFPH